MNCWLWWKGNFLGRRWYLWAYSFLYCRWWNCFLLMFGKRSFLLLFQIFINMLDLIRFFMQHFLFLRFYIFVKLAILTKISPFCVLQRLWLKLNFCLELSIYGLGFRFRSNHIGLLLSFLKDFLLLFFYIFRGRFFGRTNCFLWCLRDHVFHCKNLWSLNYFSFCFWQQIGISGCFDWIY